MPTPIRIMFTTALLYCFVLLGCEAIRNFPRTCGTDEACFPWASNGPYCGRGNSLNLRFVVDIAPENAYYPQGGLQKETVMTYGFCPRVDELQAFNLTNAGTYMATVAPSNSNSTNITLSKQLDFQYLYAFGFGDVGSEEMPAENSYGRTVVMDDKTNACPIGQIGIAKFVVLNISMDNGKFRYFPDESLHPQGTGFVPSCDGDVCMYDTEGVCIGEEGRKMCAKCYSDVDEVINMPLQVWVSYYGTDSKGRKLRSGANNPMNFRVYSGSGVYDSIDESVSRLEAGKTAQDSEDLGP